jgi:hypothetical protein
VGRCDARASKGEQYIVCERVGEEQDSGGLGAERRGEAQLRQRQPLSGSLWAICQSNAQPGHHVQVDTDVGSGLLCLRTYLTANQILHAPPSNCIPIHACCVLRPIHFGRRRLLVGF